MPITTLTIGVPHSSVCCHIPLSVLGGGGIKGLGDRLLLFLSCLLFSHCFIILGVCLYITCLAQACNPSAKEAETELSLRAPWAKKTCLKNSNK